MRRRMALILLFLFLLTATGLSAELVVCDDCLQMAVFSCCSVDVGEDDCGERCGSCEDDTTVSVRAIVARKGSQVEANDHTVWIPMVSGLLEHASRIHCDQPVLLQPPCTTLPSHISTTVLLS